MGLAVRRTLWAVLIAVAFASCSPTRPSCDTEETSCLLSQYAYDVDRMPPRFSASFQIAETANFENVADEIEAGNVELDAVASAHLIQAYFETSAGEICESQRFLSFLRRETARIEPSGPRDAQAMIERVNCDKE